MLTSYLQSYSLPERSMNKPVLTARMSSKGQIVVPKEVRDAHGWKAGTEFEVIDKGGEVAIKPIEKTDRRFPKVTAEAFLAMVPSIDRPFPTDEEMEQAILREAARRFREKSD